MLVGVEILVLSNSQAIIFRITTSDCVQNPSMELMGVLQQKTIATQEQVIFAHT
jgi:hypothetical protein